MSLLLSLFPGIGLLDRAFEEEGFVVVRGPDVLWGGDIRKFHPPAGKFDGVIGGPPCQMFSSLARLVEANGHKTRFGNLIPEYERCVKEALPAWFVMENVEAAPAPNVEGYGIHSFIIDNSLLAGDDGFGHEQRRLRKFTFGIRGGEAPNLMRWIDLATFVLPDPARTLTQYPVNNSKAAKTRSVCATSTGGQPRPANGARAGRYRLDDAIRLQGLPADFLIDAPFTAEGKLKAVANGVPLTMGKAIARAVKEATITTGA
jgi:DNA (cytosine-5)-methyltransferase 1